VQILRNWNEIGAAVRNLKHSGLPLHTDPPKCWDFWQIREFLLRHGVGPGAAIVDLGCGAALGGSVTLEFLRSLGHTRLVGIDRYIPYYARLGAALRGWKIFRNPRPYRLIQGDLTQTRLGAGSVDAAILLSVIEHGVDLQRLFGELSRVMKPGGCVYLSTDYWQEPLTPAPRLSASGARDNEALPWKIFDRESISALLRSARAFGFEEAGGGTIPPGEDRPVHWLGLDYTFIALDLRKVQP
jgi:SAM-dependent methyltransferase